MNPEKIHTILLTERQVTLLDMFLDELSDHMSNAGCNDLPEELRDMFTKEEGEKIAQEFEVYNNPTNPDGPSWPIPDFCLLHWLKRKIKDQIHAK